MSDLRSCREAVDHFRLIIDATNTDSRYNEGFVDGLEFCISHLSTMPSAQPEIIRCRDCKYWREHKYAKETKRYIPFCGFNAIYTKADDFCSRAERKENR